MNDSERNIANEPVWLTATPTVSAFPFYITEAGYFQTDHTYSIERLQHDSYLLMYTISGKGIVKTENTVISLLPNDAVIIDCHNYHHYYCAETKWDFMWMHIKGNGIPGLFHIIYPNSVCPLHITNTYDFKQLFTNLIHKIRKNDIINASKISSAVHHILNILLASALESEQSKLRKEHTKDIQAVISFIKKNYALCITIDDMISSIHISKYHFIRIFKRVMGVTPYRYLMNYRINRSKTLLGTTDKTISEIAECCGFPDTSNFITQFKTHTGQKPLQYKKYFS